MKKILVAGASGRLGQLIVRQLKHQGYWVRALVRMEKKWEQLRIPVDDAVQADVSVRQSLQTCCQDIDAVISCAGASMDLKNLSDRSTFTSVDLHGNTNLLTASRDAGVKKFVYVSAAGSELLQHIEYSRSHYQFEQTLAASGIRFSVIKPTGFFYFLGEILAMAKKGRGLLIGNGEHTTNPIHEQDVAEACCAALTNDAGEMIIGGPEVFSRRGIVDLAFQVAGKQPHIITIPPKVFSALTYPSTLVNPRIHALLAFGGAVSEMDIVGPKYGKRRLQEYFQSL
ncbi:MAG: SDR family oxidoreductase [Bacteroidota bacterium]